MADGRHTAADHAVGTWRRLIADLAAGDGGGDERLREKLFVLQQQLQEDLFGQIPAYLERRDDIDSGDPRLAIVLDVLEALSLTEPSDPSYSWMRGGVLFKVGRDLEAAEDYLVAARRFTEAARERDHVTGDEEAWAETALYHAARCFALGGHLLAAASLLPRLSPESRDEIRALLSPLSADE